MSANNPGGDTIAVGCCESNGTAKVRPVVFAIFKTVANDP